MNEFGHVFSGLHPEERRKRNLKKKKIREKIKIHLPLELRATEQYSEISDLS